jgi:hypothetical protein
MNREKLGIAIRSGNIEWQRHSLERMLERGITRDNVKQVLLSGDVIEDYAEDTPYPSALFLGWAEKTPLHAVVALDERIPHCFVITAYRPDLEHFEPDFKTRRKHGNR